MLKAIFPILSQKLKFKKRLRAREQCHVEYNKTIAEKEFSFKLIR